jgi:hypothetical protein
MRFVPSESTFAYFEMLAGYMRSHGKPVAFYSDKHSVFRVASPLPVWIGKAASWFDEPGGATQVQSDATVAQLLADGVLVRMPATAAPC